MSPGVNNSPIVHIGPSHFFRGHLLPILQTSNPGLDVTAISLRRPDTRNELRPNNYQYDLAVRHAHGGFESMRIKNLKEIIVHGEEFERAVSQIAAPSTEIITLTITKGAYKHSTQEPINFNINTGKLTNKDTGQELNPSAGAVIAAAFYRRFKQGQNLPYLMALDNGERLSSTMKSNILFFAEYGEQQFVDWVRQNLVVIDTMVDRIVPNGVFFKQEVFMEGIESIDELVSPIYSEPYPLASLVMGATPEHPILNRLADHPNVLTNRDDVKYSRMKIRMVNGTHFALGMMARLAGYETTREAMENPVIRVFVDGYINRMRVSLKSHEMITSVDTYDYADEVFERFAHPYMDDPLERLARDSTDKLNPRLIEPLKDLLAQSKNHDMLDMVVVGWAQYIARAAQDPSFEIRDSKAQSLNLLDQPRSYYQNLDIIFNNDRLEVFDVLAQQEDIKHTLDLAKQRYDYFIEAVKFARENPDVEINLADVAKKLGVQDVLSRPANANGAQVDLVRTPKIADKTVHLGRNLSRETSGSGLGIE